MRACPGDPTPGWVLGQFQSLRAQQIGNLLGDDMPGDPVPEDAFDRALATFEDLVRDFPDSVDALAGAADVHVREGARLAESQPFTARHEFRIAARLYRRAIDASNSPEIAAGLARALIGLGEASAAAELLRGVEEGDSPGYRLELLTKAEEAAHDFASSERTARLLADLGPDAFAQGTPLFALPTIESFDGDDLEIPLVSVGLDRFAPLQVTLQPPPGGADAVVEDVSFIPPYWDDPGYVGTMANCPDWGWRRNAVLAGHAERALDGIVETAFGPAFHEIRPHRQGVQCGIVSAFDEAHDLIRLAAGEAPDLDPARLNLLHDRWQNMWRWAGDLPRAVEVIESWLDAAPGTALPMLRLGEVRYLQGQYDEAAAAFGAAARRTRQAQWNNDLGVDEALLGRGVSLLRAGRHAEGMEVLRYIERDASRGVAFYLDDDFRDALRGFAAVAYHARTLQADAARETGALQAALEDYQAAEEMLPVLERAESAGHRPERLYGNQAVALLAAGREDEAKASIDRALRADPLNPAFLMTAGFIADRRGERAAAIEYNRRTLRSDPGAFPAANDLGVQFAQDGRDGEAIAALRHAVHVNPAYALGWFNLGVVYAGMGPQHILASQGALARAITLDAELADRDRELTIDAQTYRTGLDLSKPLPPRWSFADLERVTPAASVGLLAVLLVGVGLARSTSKEGQDFASRWVTNVTDILGRLPGAPRIKAPIWALGLTVLLFLITMVRQGWLNVWALTATGVGIAVLALAAIRSRILVAKISGNALRQESWPPGMVVGVAATAAGAPWAPLPVIGDVRSPITAHAAGPVTLGVITGILLLEAAWTQVPLTRSLAIAGLIMAASVLLPVAPLDGARLEKPGLIVGAGLIGAASLIVLGLI